MKVRSVFKIAALYVFALTTAVACGKFETAKNGTRGTTNGTGTVVVDGTPGPVSASNINFDRVEPTVINLDDYMNNVYSIQVDFTHGSRKFKYDLFPQLYPRTQDGVEFVIGSMDYNLQGVCGNSDCSKYAVLIDVTDTSNGTQLQRVEYWDRTISATTPQKRLTDTDFRTVSDAYEALSFQSLN